jgi:hypothetical protein
MPKEPITKVIFRKWPKKEGGGVIALFPAEASTVGDPYSCSSYMHVGQHGAASVHLTYYTKPAKPEEYRDLYRELRGLGYRLKVVKKFTRGDQRERERQLKL